MTASSWYSHEQIILSSFVFAIVLTLSCAAMGLYRRSLSLQDYNLLARTSVSFAIALIILIAIYYFIPEFLIGRSVLVAAIFFALVSIVITRDLFYKFVNLETFKNRVLVIGSGSKASKLSEINNSFIHKGFQVVGFIGFSGEQATVDQQETINYDNENIRAIAEELKVDELVVALDDNRRFMPLKSLLDCKMSGFKVTDMVSFYEREQGIISLEHTYPGWLIFCDGFAQGGLRVWEKRLFDLLASGLLLIVTWPVMLITVLAIYIESRGHGPIFYRQIRVGEEGKNFEVLKFRSMRCDAEKNGVQWAQTQDDRVTDVGAIIRKYRIDELPQIFNVFNGQMSFVGPRPERPEFVSGFEERIPYYRERHRVKPGITGWAQLCYPYGASEDDTVQKLQYDLYYVKNYSLFLDISIMFNTVEVVLWGKGAR
ncbi:MAG: TIGR03013 family PEP-CTERM/XrtA system glycosyltransferase [Methylovulum sp.]|uniref:TIGR03013 family XrtA/PEP-CTERM system glycosyltransferase n=2 Tax=Methylovulum sp. TaxID=1916980 RepID=UPI00262F024A|nr:TIGR03013 family XrtA/PEP-CTERM system glycosyltransferase [Methylovulum sp.]MDD2724804.1 TIGR03013 family PEP-CTERM/XrtA system glycosyltransferase [Methylovulum sp.]